MPSRLRRHNESGHVHFVTISTFRRLMFFRHASVRTAFIEAMKTVRDRLPIRWIAYVVMPEHVHLAVLPQCCGEQEPVQISAVLNELKSFSGKSCKEALRQVWRGRKSLGTAPLDAWATGTLLAGRTRNGLAESERMFWKPRGYDFNILSEETLLEKVNYMHANPVRRGLVVHPERWRWSSYRFYEFGDASLIAMDWDGGFPVV